MTDSKPTAKRGRPRKTAEPETAAQSSPELLGVTRPVAHTTLSVLEVQDSADLDALMLSPQLSPFLVVRLDERMALVQPGKEKQVLELLRKSGHTPKVAAG